VVACDKDDDDNDHHELSKQDRNFMHDASIANLSEIAAGQIASSRGNNAAVREFGEMMVDEHTKAQSELVAIGNSLNVDLPDEPDSMHKAEAAMLQTLSGATFDSVYIAAQIRDHGNARDLFRTEKIGGSNREVKDYAERTLPHIEMHLAKADSIRNVLQ
jgi:putative membrane protein